jgi:hypothetical protein
MAAQATVSISLEEGGALIASLWRAVDGGDGMISAVPGLVQRVLRTGVWKERSYKGKIYRHERFIDFITTKPLAGCGWKPDKVERLIKDDPNTIAMWEEAMKIGQGHRSDIVDNVNEVQGRSTGNSLRYTLARLKRERSDLFARVRSKELSANAAAIKAGFRKKPVRHCPKCGHEW